MLHSGEAYTKTNAILKLKLTFIHELLVYSMYISFSLSTVFFFTMHVRFSLSTILVPLLKTNTILKLRLLYTYVASRVHT